MDGLMIIIYMCFIIPMFPFLMILRDRQSKYLTGCLMAGMTLCFIAAYINRFLLNLSSGDSIYITTNITPISEEVLKALPVLFLAYFVLDDRDFLISAAFAVGVGFAILENAVILTSNLETVTISWAFLRGIGAAFMHGTASASVGYGMSYVKKKKKLFYSGTFSLLIAAIIYHSIFNLLVQSSLRLAAFFMPTVLFCSMAYVVYKKKNEKD